jgi:hypothetical protein
LERLQGSWFFFKLETPSDQELVFTSFLWLLIEFINNLLNRRLPIFQVHPQFLCDVGVFRWSILQMSPSYMSCIGMLVVEWINQVGDDGLLIAVGREFFAMLATEFSGALVRLISPDSPLPFLFTLGQNRIDKSRWN